MDRKPMTKIAVIGSGNVATHLCNALRASADIVQICSKTIAHAKKLASGISSDCSYTNRIQDLQNADVYIVSVTDDSIGTVLNEVPDSCKAGLWLHTSGSIGIDIFLQFNVRHGVLYPLQTFSKDIETDFSEISVFIEGNSPDVEREIFDFAESHISTHIFQADSKQRRQLHIAAVFACNFTNYMYTIANGILKQNGLPFSILAPLIKETVRKAISAQPENVQTGPAARGDIEVIRQHSLLLQHNRAEQMIYETLSNAILERYSNECHSI